MKIIGAGFSGLICGALNPGSTIYERQSELPNNHGAVLRFRSDKISVALGIPFRKVRVTKAIWFGGEVEPTPRIQNLYSQKVLGSCSSRSISNIDPVSRYIAPPDFIQQLADKCSIVFNIKYPEDFIDWETKKRDPGPLISTIPMPVMLNAIPKPIPHDAVFEKREIWSKKYRLPGADIFQTIYYPGADTYLYRASFTGDELICEYIANPDNVGENLPTICFSFGIDIDDLVQKKQNTKSQAYGKIAPIDNSTRKMIMGKLTYDHNIYSLGRYATWRNILLDDVYEDVLKIRDLMRMDLYSQRITLSEEKP